MSESLSARMTQPDEADRGPAVSALSELENAIADSRRLEYLERLFKQARPWPLVCIETLPGETRVEACNKHHGDAAGRHTAPTLREAIDKAIAGRK
jgi:hypothetical protein